MAVRPRIKPAQPLVEADETVVSAIINRGGAPAAVECAPAPVVVAAPVAAPSAEPVDAEKKFTLRLPASLLATIEKDAKDRPDRISVNTWLIGAALQRLNRVG